MVTVQDSKGFTPFAIAVYRRHFEVAKVLLEIANVQYKSQDEVSPMRRYAIAQVGSEYSSDSDEDDLGISSQVVDETFTFDNIAAVRQSVGSKVSGNMFAASPMGDQCANTWKLPLC